MSTSEATERKPEIHTFREEDVLRARAQELAARSELPTRKYEVR